MKHTVQLEIEIPDDYPDLCWRDSEQVVFDLLTNPAILFLIKMQINAEIYQKEPEVSAESKVDFLKWLDMKEEIVRNIKVTVIEETPAI
jgi:hypothetical protein